MKVKYDVQAMKVMALFENVTRARLKDFISDKDLFIVEQGELGKAIGKNASNIRKLERLLKKKIRLIEFNDEPTQFLQNLVYPAEVTDIKEDQGVITVTGKDTKSKGIIIGRERSRLNFLEDVMKRYFKVEEIKVM